MTRTIAPLVLVLLGTTVAPTSLHAQPSWWAGCYDLSVGPWEPAMPRGADSLYLSPPPRIQMDSLGWGSSEERFRVRRAPGAPPSVHPAFGEPMGGDTLRIIWSTGYAGLMMHLLPAGDGFQGEAESFWDETSTPTQTASVTARPVACNTPLPPEHSTWRRFPQSIAVENGVTVAIGARLPRDALLVEAGDSPQAPVIRNRPAGLFAGATHTLVYTSSGDTVAQIRLSYPPQEFDALLERLSLALGPPTSGPRDWPNMRLRSAGWGGRDTDVYLSERTLPSGEVKVGIILSYPQYPSRRP